MMDATPPQNERLLMSANLHRLRGEFNEAEIMVRTALQQQPSDTFAREFLGDLLAQKGDFKGAEAEYRAILQDNPGIGSVEEKLARLVLKAAPVAPMTATGDALRTDRNPVTVAILSLMFPGAGQFYMKDRVKGLIYAAIGALLLFAMIPAVIGIVKPITNAVSNGLESGGLEGGGNIAAPTAKGVMQVSLLSILFFVVQIVSAYDGYMTAKRVYQPR